MKKPDVKENLKTREASGWVDSDDKVVCVLYLLMRDHVVPGDMSEVIRNVMTKPNKSYQFTNGWLAEYAKYLAEKLRNTEEVES